MGEMRNGYKIFVVYPKMKGHLEGIGVDELLLLKCVLKK
jgi:hypothetical protein